MTLARLKRERCKDSVKLEELRTCQQEERDMLRHRFGILSAALILASLTLAQAQTFRWAPPASVATMDPHASGDTTTRNILINVYEGLVRLNQTSELDPELAVSWEAIEPTVWRFKLRPGVTFHDGNAFTADDVVFSFKRATASRKEWRWRAR